MIVFLYIHIYIYPNFSTEQHYTCFHIQYTEFVLKLSSLLKRSQQNVCIIGKKVNDILRATKSEMFFLLSVALILYLFQFVLKKKELPTEFTDLHI